MGKLVSLIGLGIKARRVVVGTDGVRNGLKRGSVRLVVVARDHSQRTKEKVVRLARGRGVEVVVGPEAAELGRLAGVRSVQVIGVTDPNLASGISAYSAENGARRN